MAGGGTSAIPRPPLHKPVRPQPNLQPVPLNLWIKPPWIKLQRLKPPRLSPATFTLSRRSSNLRQLRRRKPRIALLMDCQPN